MKRSVLFICLVAMGFSTPALATVIISDTYTAPDNTALTTGHTPDVNLPGGSYISQNSPNRIGGSAAGGTADPVSNVAVVGGDGAWAISLASAIGYVKPTDFTISAVLNLNGMTLGASQPLNVGDIGITRGITLGFFDNTFPSNFALRRSPDGITYSPSGQLLLVEPNPSGIKVDAATGLSFPTSGSHTLSYEVNTISGNISNVTFDGSPVTFTSGSIANGMFTDLATSYAGNYAADNGGGVSGTLDNFTITAVPEPGALLLGVTALFGLSLVAARRRAQR